MLQLLSDDERSACNGRASPALSPPSPLQVGHSLGALLHALIGSRYPIVSSGNVLMSFNNRPATGAAGRPCPPPPHRRRLRSHRLLIRQCLQRCRLLHSWQCWRCRRRCLYRGVAA